jgi:ubiquinone/menaquinone biosynthesis C-methylase UbiE
VTDTGFLLPTPAEVGEFYDRNNRAIARFQGGNMHYGYWTGPDDDSSFEVAGARLTDIMTGKLRLKPGDVLLDVGCGPGQPAVQVAKATGASVVGISISARDVELATARAAAEGLADRVTFRHADALDLPFEPASFDAVLALESIVHIPDRARVLAEIARVVRPGGRVALTDFIWRGSDVERDPDEQAALVQALAAWRAAPLVRPEDYLSFAAGAGLVIDEMVDITEHTRYSNPRTYLAMIEYAREHDDLPPDLAHMVSLMVDDNWVETLDTPEYLTEGVLIVVAHRPGA